MLRMDDHVVRNAGRRRLLPTGAFNPRAPLGAVSLVMALIGGCTTAVVYVPYVDVRVGMHAPITGGYLSSVLPVAWAAAALASASVSAWAHRFIVSGPIFVTLGLILTGWALTTGSPVLIAVALVPVGAGIGVAWAYLGSLLIEFAEPNERDIAAAFISAVNLISQAFGAALAGMIANIAGFGNPALDFNRGRACGLLAIPDDLIVSGSCAALRHSGDPQSRGSVGGSITTAGRGGAGRVATSLRQCGCRLGEPSHAANEIAVAFKGSRTAAAAFALHWVRGRTRS